MQIFDIHAHIYPDAIADRAVHAISHAYDDVEVRNDGRLTTLLREMDEAGVAQFAAHSVATTPHQVHSINDFILRSAKAHPDRIVPFAALHPDTEDIPGTVDQILAAGFKGIKLHPECQNFKVDDPHAVEMFAALAGRLPVLLHCGDSKKDNSAPARVRRLLSLLPNLTLVCAHLGGWTRWEKAAEELTGANVWVDTSSSLYALSPETAVRIIRGYGTDRVLYGSDYPMWTPKEEVARFMALPLSDDEREKILWKNHLALLES